MYWVAAFAIAIRVLQDLFFKLDGDGEEEAEAASLVAEEGNEASSSPASKKSQHFIYKNFWTLSVISSNSYQ
ncbi:hypothetical protein QYF36_012432 [Acer negundo]|nr:hypothetical protein QYF36_012432 [Acer negundo]